MPKLKIEQGDWVVVCDGSKALILENIGDEKFPNLHMKEVYEQKNGPTHEQGSDKPGRSINSIDSRRSAMEQTGWPPRRRARIGRYQVVDYGGAAARARDTPPGLFAERQARAAPRTGQGLCEVSGARNREASRRQLSAAVRCAKGGRWRAVLAGDKSNS